MDRLTEAQAEFASQFLGPGDPLSHDNVNLAAGLWGVEPAVVWAVARVEGGGRGFLPEEADGRRLPKILFEAHKFGRMTDWQFNASHPHVSTSSMAEARKLYRGGIAEWQRLADAAALDYDAAIQSASWGLFQIMGFNYLSAGATSPFAFALDMATNEGAHLRGFFHLLDNHRLLGPLREKRWADFARGYNGPAYAVNAYDVKLAAEYQRRLRDGTGELHNPGREQVRQVQVALNAHGANPQLTVDGFMGPKTDAAIRRFQASKGLVVDGIAGPRTKAALGI